MEIFGRKIWDVGKRVEAETWHYENHLLSDRMRS